VTALATAQQRLTAKLIPALERLLDRGHTFTEISVAALMNEAGMSRRTFYMYFADKAGFLREATTDAVAAMMDAIDPWWEKAPGMSLAELTTSMASMLTAYEAHRGLMRAMVEAASYDETINALHDEQLRRVADAIERHIRTGQASGAVPARIEPRTVAAWLTMLQSIGLADMPATDTPAQRLRRLAAVSEILWRTLYLVEPQ